MKRSTDGLEQMLLGLHLGNRYAEQGAWGAALAATEVARTHRSSAKPIRWRDQLGWIADQNIFQFNWRLGRMASEFPGAAPRSALPALTRTDSLLAGALSKYLEDQFDLGFADPYQQTVSFQAEDTSETQLQSAVLRAEWLAYWQQTLGMRKLLGRYQLISRLATRQELSPAALDLLRRAGDDKGLRAAARTVARLGPIAPLQEVTTAFIRNWSVGAAPSASLVLLAEGADSLGEEDADLAAQRLIESPGLFREAWVDAPRALAQIATVAPPSRQTAVAAFVLDTVKANESHAGLVQALEQVTGVVAWAEVDSAVRKRWLSFATAEYRSGTDAQFVAVRALVSLASLEQSAVASFLHKELLERPDLRSLAVTVQAFGEVPLSLRTTSFQLVADALASIRKEAGAGSWGFGGFDVGALSVALLRQWPRVRNPWEELIEFLFDPRVGMSHKTGALRMLADQRTRLPRWVSETLKESLPRLEAFDEMMAGQDAFEAAKLGLAIRLRALVSEEVLARVLQLAASSPFARIQASQSLKTAQYQIGSEVATALALSLSQDEHHEVRAAAADALSMLETNPEGGSLRAMTVARLRELLAEPGTIVPLAALAGLVEAAHARLNMIGEFTRQAEQLADTHPSYRVRWSARRFLEAARTESETVSRAKSKS
jgi:hypothetical protein